MASMAEIAVKLKEPAYLDKVKSGANYELVLALNADKPFPKEWQPLSADRFRAIVASQWPRLTSGQKETVRFLLEGGSVDLSDAGVRDLVASVFSDAATRASLQSAARVDVVVDLEDIRQAVAIMSESHINARAL